MKNKIVLNVYRPDRGMCGVVRLDEEIEVKRSEGGTE